MQQIFSHSKRRQALQFGLLRTLTGITGFLVALQSIGQLDPRDIVVLLILALLLFLYLSYARSPRQNLQMKSP